MEKYCGICKRILSTEKFSKSSYAHDGLQTRCKECVAIYHKAYMANPYSRKKKMTYDNAFNKTPSARKKRLDRQRNRRKNIQAVGDKHRKEVSDQYHNDPKYRAKVIERAVKNSRKTRAKRMMAEGSHTDKEWKDLCNKYDNCCLRCGKQGKLSRDHVIPLAKGGTDYIDNIQPLCLQCNLRKHTKTEDYRVGWHKFTTPHNDPDTN